MAAVTGRPETEAYLRDLGAARIIPRAELAETVQWNDVTIVIRPIRPED